MKQYTADKHAQYTLQIATPIVTAVLIGLVWYFLAVLPHWLLWTLTAVLAAAAILLYADTGVAVQQHFSGTLCRCHRHEFYPAACLWRHGHSVVFEQF